MVEFKHNIEPNSIAFRKFWYVITMLDAFSQAVGMGELMVTSLYRPRDKGLHGEFLAADIRTNDKPKWFVMALEMIMVVLKRCDSTIQHEPHRKLKGTVNAHLHIEIDIGDPI